MSILESIIGAYGRAFSAEIAVEAVKELDDLRVKAARCDRYETEGPAVMMSEREIALLYCRTDRSEPGSYDTPGGLVAIAEAQHARSYAAEQAAEERGAARERARLRPLTIAGVEACTALLDSCSEYLRQTMVANPEWAQGPRAVETARQMLARELYEQGAAELDAPGRQEEP